MNQHRGRQHARPSLCIHFGQHLIMPVRPHACPFALQGLVNPRSGAAIEREGPESLRSETHCIGNDMGLS